jgi:hypothetical protein
VIRLSLTDGRNSFGNGMPAIEVTYGRAIVPDVFVSTKVVKSLLRSDLTTGERASGR